MVKCEIFMRMSVAIRDAENKTNHEKSVDFTNTLSFYEIHIAGAWGLNFKIPIPPALVMYPKKMSIESQVKVSELQSQPLVPQVQTLLHEVQKECHDVC